MTLLEETARNAYRDYMPNKMAAIRHIRSICRVRIKTAVEALAVAQEAADIVKGEK